MVLFPISLRSPSQVVCVFLIGCLFLLTLLSGCAPHGLLSLRQEADGHFKEALRLSGIDLYAERSSAETIDPASLENALVEAQLAVDIDPFHFSAQLFVLELLALLDDKDAHRARLHYLLDIFPDALPIRQEAARIEMTVFDDSRSAASIIDEGLLRSPSNIVLRLLKTELLVEAGASEEEIFQQIDELVAFQCRRQSGLAGNDANLFWFHIIRLCVVLSEKDLNAGTVQPLLEVAQKFPEQLNVCLRLLYQSGMLGAAKDLFVHACGDDRACFELKLATARLLVLLDERQPAAKLLKELDADAPPGRQTEITALRGHILFLDGKPEEALGIFRQILSDDPAHIDAIQGFWLIYERTPLVGIDEAVTVLEEAAAVTRSDEVRILLRELARSIQTLPQNREVPPDQPVSPEK